MKLLVDCQALQSEGSRNRGIGRYLKGLVTGLCATKGDHEILLAFNGSYLDSLHEVMNGFRHMIGPDRILVWTQIPGVNYWLNNEEAHAKRRIAEKLRELFFAQFLPDVVLTGSVIEGTGNTVTSVGHFNGAFRNAVVSYDMIPFLQREAYLKEFRIRNCYLAKLEWMKRADIIFSISEATKRDVVKTLSLSQENVFNIAAGCDDVFARNNGHSMSENKVCYENGITKPFVLYTAGVDKRKNVETLLHAWSLIDGHIRAHHQLVIVCAHDQVWLDHHRMKCASLGVSDVVFTGFVEDRLLCDLYNSCKLFVFPSLYEGFGLPVLEAMKCGKAVLCSNTSSMPEIAGDSRMLFDPLDARTIANKMSEVLLDESLRVSLEKHSVTQAMKFSWEASARRVWQQLEEGMTRWAPVEASWRKMTPVEMRALLLDSIKHELAHISVSHYPGIAKAIVRNLQGSP